MLHARWRVFWIVAVIMVGYSLPSHAVVEEIEVIADVIGTDPRDAQEKAIDYAQKRAFFLVLSKRDPQNAERIARSMTTEQILQHIRGYEILQDKFEDNRYLGQFKVSVSDDLVQRMLVPEESLMPTEKLPLLVMPVLNDGEKIMLWDEGNVWRSLWNTVALEKGENLLVMPYGDPTDIDIVDHATVLSYDYQRMLPLMQRYGTDEMVVALATYKQEREPVGLSVTLRRLGVGVDKIKELYYEAEEPEVTPEVLLVDAAHNIAGQLKEIARARETRRQQQLLQAKAVRLQAQFRRVSEWAEMQNRLANLPRVLRLDVENISIRSADAVLHFEGEETHLMQMMAANGMRVLPQHGYWAVSF